MKTMSSWVKTSFSLCRNFQRRTCSTSAASLTKTRELNSLLNPQSPDYNPAKLFLQKDVQRLLYSVTGFDLKRLETSSKKTRMLMLPEVRFLSEEELEIERRRATLRAKRKFKMPPVLAPRKPGGDVLQTDERLSKLLEHKLVFTDVSYGGSDRTRIVVVREKNGTLRSATWNEKMRMSQIYFPQFGREVFVPRMFQPEFLSDSLNSVSAHYILSRACVQFEPDDPDFIRVTHAVYDHVDRHGTYDDLWSTRYFGGLVFYLCGVARLDGLLLDRLQRRRLEDAASVVQLLSVLHPLCKCALSIEMENAESDADLVRVYLKTMGNAKTQLKAALNRCEKDEIVNVAVAV